MYRTLNTMNVWLTATHASPCQSDFSLKDYHVKWCNSIYQNCSESSKCPRKNSPPSPKKGLGKSVVCALRMSFAGAGVQRVGHAHCPAAYGTKTRRWSPSWRLDLDMLLLSELLSEQWLQKDQELIKPKVAKINLDDCYNRRKAFSFPKDAFPGDWVTVLEAPY